MQEPIAIDNNIADAERVAGARLVPVLVLCQPRWVDRDRDVLYKNKHFQFDRPRPTALTCSLNGVVVCAIAFLS